MQSKTFPHPHMQDWQQIPEMLNRSPSGSPSQQRAGPSPSPRRQLSSPGTDLESQGPSQDSPGVHAPLDQPAGIDSDDNFEVDDDADEQQVKSLLCTCCVRAVYLLCTCCVTAVYLPFTVRQPCTVSGLGPCLLARMTHLPQLLGADLQRAAFIEQSCAVQPGWMQQASDIHLHVSVAQLTMPWAGSPHDCGVVACAHFTFEDDTSRICTI